MKELIDTLLGISHQLVGAMKNENATETLRRRSHPEIDVGEEQLSYLVEQGFPTKDIIIMFWM